jgi:hypothetical protein
LYEKRSPPRSVEVRFFGGSSSRKMDIYYCFYSLFKNPAKLDIKVEQVNPRKNEAIYPVTTIVPLMH